MLGWPGLGGNGDAQGNLEQGGEGEEGKEANVGKPQLTHFAKGNGTCENCGEQKKGHIGATCPHGPKGWHYATHTAKGGGKMGKGKKGKGEKGNSGT